MNLKNKFEFIKKQDKNKSTVVILVLLSLIVFVAFSFSKTINYYVEKSVSGEFDYNYYFAGLFESTDNYPDLSESMDKLKKIKYVKDVFSTSESEYIVGVNKLGDKKMDGYVRLVGQTEEDLKRISNNNYKDKYSIICHENYYPNIDADTNIWVMRNKFISMKKYKGSVMNISYAHLKTHEKFTDNLNIVEVLKNDKVQIDENVCFASRELLWDIYQKEFDGVNDDDFWEDFFVDYDLEHYDEVESEFNKLGFSVSRENRNRLDDFTLPKFLAKLKLTLLFASVIVIGIFISVFNKNIIKDKVKTYSILKTLGMHDKEYNNLLDLESIWIVIRGLIASIIVSLIFSFIVVIIRYYYPFFLMKVYLIFDWMSLIIYYLAVLILLCITNYIYFKKIKKKSIVENLGE